VDNVLEESPAKTAGLERNDVVQKLDDQWLVNPPQFEALIRRAGSGAEVTLTILRGGAEKKLSVKVGEKLMPERRPMRVFDPAQGDLRDPRAEFNPRDPAAAPFDSRIEEAAGALGDPRAARDRVRMIRRDDAGSYAITSVDGRSVFTMKRPDGTVAWTGPVETPEERAAMPEDVRRKFDELEKNRPVPRPSPAIRRDGGQQQPRPREPEPVR
jgi:PDZ domain